MSAPVTPRIPRAGCCVRGPDPRLLSRLDAAFATEVPAELGFGF